MITLLLFLICSTILSSLTVLMLINLPKRLSMQIAPVTYLYATIPGVNFILFISMLPEYINFTKGIK